MDVCDCHPCVFFPPACFVFSECFYTLVLSPLVRSHLTRSLEKVRDRDGDKENCFNKYKWLLARKVEQEVVSTSPLPPLPTKSNNLDR